MEVDIDAHQSVLHRWVGRHTTEATTAANRALERAAHLDPNQSALHRDACLRVTLAAVDAALMGVEPERMLELAERLAVLSAGFNDQAHARALVAGALALRLLGHNHEAAQRARRAWEEARQRVLPQSAMEAGPLLARTLLSLGRLEEAEEVIDEYLALGERLAGFRPGRAFQDVVPALLHAVKGHWSRSIALLERVANDETEAHYRLHARLERASLLARHDQIRSATVVLSDIEKSEFDARASGCVRCLLEVSLRGAECFARIGLYEEASQFLTRGTDSPVGAGYLRWCWLAAVAAMSTGAEAATAWEAAHAEASSQGLLLESLQNQVDLAISLAPFARSRAAEVARAAGETASTMGAETEARAADRVLRNLGVRTWHRGAGDKLAGPHRALTDRERQIAEMIRAGSTNPEVAAALFLSRKTVERHVSNILAKLGVRNRAELASVIAPDH
jgi:DNA-binding NarL/FixJ family response regulator